MPKDTCITSNIANYTRLYIAILFPKEIIPIKCLALFSVQMHMLVFIYIKCIFIANQ